MGYFKKHLRFQRDKPYFSLTLLLKYGLLYDTLVYFAIYHAIKGVDMLLAKRLYSLVLACFFVCNVPAPYVFAAQQPLSLPAAGKLLPLSSPSQDMVLRGMRIDVRNPLKFEFILDANKVPRVEKEEFERLVSYFMAALTIPEKDFWVNLSPYEKDYIISEKVADTDFGRDLLVEDYTLKQSLPLFS